MTKFTLVRAVALLLLCASLRAADERGLPNAFFAMETGIHGPPAEVAQTLKELGYAGIGGGNYSAALVKELEDRGLKFFNAYFTLTLDSEKPAITPALKTAIDGLKGHQSALWLAIAKVTTNGVAVSRDASQGDEIAVRKLREIVEAAQANGIAVSIYPHTGSWLATCDDAVRVVKKFNAPGLGATFNLCHFLKVEGDRDPEPVLRAALPYLTFVTVNGADAGDTKKMGWDRLIQTLDHGTYDVGAFLRIIRRVGYTGPIGFQGYGIKGNERDNITRTMTAWKKLSSEPVK